MMANEEILALVYRVIFGRDPVQRTLPSEALFPMRSFERKSPFFSGFFAGTLGRN